jgi:hypothetical protein
MNNEETKKPYRVLLGNRVYIKLDLPVYTLEMAEETKKKLISEAAQKLSKGVVYDVGNAVVVAKDSPKEGDTVMVSMQGVTRGELVNLTPELSVLMVSPLDIIQIW